MHPICSCYFSSFFPAARSAAVENENGFRLRSPRAAVLLGCVGAGFVHQGSGCSWKFRRHANGFCDFRWSMGPCGMWLTFPMGCGALSGVFYSEYVLLSLVLLLPATAASSPSRTTRLGLPRHRLLVLLALTTSTTTTQLLLVRRL